MASQYSSLLSKLNASVDATRHFYSRQHLISDCKCEDCNFYISVVLNYGFSIHADLSAAGVDVTKNIVLEPAEEVWCVRDEDGKLLYARHMYHIVGSLIDAQAEFGFQFLEKRYSFNISLRQIEEQGVRVYLEIRKEEEN